MDYPLLLPLHKVNYFQKTRICFIKFAPENSGGDAVNKIESTPKNKLFGVSFLFVSSQRVEGLFCQIK